MVNSSISRPSSKTAELNWTSNATGWQWHIYTNLKSLLTLSPCLLATNAGESHASPPKNLKHCKEAAGNPRKERLYPHVHAESKIKIHHFESSKRTCLVQKCQVPTLPSVKTNLPKSYFCFLMQCSSLTFFLFYFIGFRWPTACDEWSSWSELKTEFGISHLINTFLFTLTVKKRAPTLQGIKSCYKFKTKRAQLCSRCLLYSSQRYQLQKCWLNLSTTSYEC